MMFKFKPKKKKETSFYIILVSWLKCTNSVMTKMGTKGRQRAGYVCVEEGGGGGVLAKNTKRRLLTFIWIFYNSKYILYLKICKKNPHK
jgi:hypothetical protein